MYGIAPKLPVIITKADGFSVTKTLMENTQQNLKNLILTAPGERIMDPDFGVGARNFLFLNFNEQNIDAVIQEKIDKYMPFLSDVDVHVDSDPDKGVLAVKISYRISGVLSEQELSLEIQSNINLSG